VFCCGVDDLKPLAVDASYSQSVLPKPRPIKASASSLDPVMPESSLPKVPSMSSDDGTLSSPAAFRPFRPQLPATSGEMVPHLLSQAVLPSQTSSQSLLSPSVVKLSTAAAATVMSQTDIDTKPVVTSFSSSNGISTISAPLVASLMLHPTVSSFQLVSAISAGHLAGAASRATVAQPIQYIVPPMALSDTGGKIMQMVPTGMPAASQSTTQQLAGFQLTALPRAAIQLNNGQQVLMLCQQSQAQHGQQQQHQQMQNSSLSSVLPVMVAAGGTQQLAVTK